ERLACFDPGQRVLIVGRTHLAPAPAGCEVDRIDFHGEPRAAALEALRARIAEFAPTWVVAVGGGAVIDAAKFLWALYEHPHLVLSQKLPPATGPLRHKARFAAVPTTAGSGSEASQAAVLTADDGTKIPYVSAEWVPDLAILDPALTVTLPAAL